MRRWVLGIVGGAVVAAGISLAPVQAVTLTPTDPGRQCGWPIAYPGEGNYAYPDTNAAYFVQAAIINPGDRIVISGVHPKARYWSMQTYRFSDSTLLDSVNDVTVKSIGKGAKARWTLTVVPPGADKGRDPNVLTAAGAFDGVTFGSNITVIILRVYVSQTPDESGGPLPAVTLISGKGKSAKTTKLATCTPEQVGPPENRPVLEPAVGASSRFGRGASERFYPSADTSYLVAQQAYERDSIVVVTGKAPRIRKDVRYWSLCQNVNLGDLPVVDCLRDEQITLDSQGFYRIAVASTEQISRADRAAYGDVDFLDWGQPTAGSYADSFLLFRNVLPSNRFAGAISRVPVGAFADDHIGDYAPVLTVMSRAEFDSAFRTQS